jgi:hypothetical protein
MNNFSILEHEREQVLARVFRKLGLEGKLRERWDRLGYAPKNLQLSLFETSP